MEWLDNLKQEIAYPFVKFQQWYENDEDNRLVFWATTVAACVVTCIFYTAAGLGLRAVVRAVSDDTTITVVSGNPCLNEKGLVKAWAPSSCYVDGLARTAVQPKTEDERITAMTRNNDASVTPTNDNAYNPPCVKDGLPGCTDKVYGKRMVSGIIVSTTLHDDEKLTDDNHLQPDYTEVEIDPCNGGECENVKEKFCGNVLDQFTPGHKIRQVISESKQNDYDGCYVVYPVQLTFGGDYYRPRKK
jgi:hypothetical protein